MTEIMEYFEIPQMESVYPIPGARYAIDPLPFFFALVSAPVVVALLFFWVVLIPVFAMAIGGLPYLIVGTPVLMIYLYHRQGSPEGAAACGALAIVVGCGFFAIGAALTRNHTDFAGILVFGAFAVIHATAWGFAFGKLYNRWRSDASRQPLPPFPNQTLKGPFPC